MNGRTGVRMKDEPFEELLESVREGGAILRKEAEPSRRVVIEEPDVTTVREHYGLSQERFATMLGIRVRTLQNWEQGRRRPPRSGARAASRGRGPSRGGIGRSQEGELAC